MYACGFTEGMLSDPSRLNWDGDGPRPVPWAAWYPVDSDAVVREYLIGEPDSPLFTMGDVAVDAQISPESQTWPLVLLSHGTGGSAQGLGWLGRSLATRGYLCLGVSHHGNSAIEPYRAEGFLCWWERAADLSFALEQVNGLERIGGRANPDLTYVVGFSLGGYTALALAGAITSVERFEDWLTANQISGGGPKEFPDLSEHVPALLASSEQFRLSQSRGRADYGNPRLKAFVTLAPAPPVRAFEPDSVAAIDKPTLIIAGEADMEAPFEHCASWLKQRNPRFDLRSLGPEVGHYVFLCEATAHGKRVAPDICQDPATIVRKDIHSSTSKMINAFFEEVDLGSGLSLQHD